MIAAGEQVGVAVAVEIFAVDRAAQALFLGVWPGNAWMAWRWRRRPWPAQLVSLGRLPLQVPLIRAAGRVARS